MAKPLNSFIKKPTELHLKIMLTGPKSAGKTFFCMNAPKPILFIDTEHGSDNFINSGADVAYPTEAYTVDEVNEILDSVIADKGVNIKTVVIDSLSNIYQNLINSTIKGDKANESEWGVIKLKWATLLDRLARLPTHVIFTTKDRKSSRQETVSTIDVNTDYVVDLGLRLSRAGSIVTGTVTKEDRNINGSLFKDKSQIKPVSFDIIYNKIKEYNESKKNDGKASEKKAENFTQEAAVRTPESIRELSEKQSLDNIDAAKEIIKSLTTKSEITDLYKSMTKRLQDAVLPTIKERLAELEKTNEEAA